MKESAKNMDDLIEGLSNDLCKIKKMPHPLKRAIPWFTLAIAYVFFTLWIFGVRDNAQAFFTNQYNIFELFLMGTMFICSTFCSIWLCVPDMRGQKWMLSVPVALFALFCVWISLKMVFEPHDLLTMRWHSCITEGIVFGAIPAIFLAFITISGKTTRPIWLAFMNALAVGSLGYIALRITCGSDDIGHILSFHIMPYVIVGFIISVLGRYIYKW